MARLLDHVDTKLGYELTGDGPKNHSKCIRTQQSTHVGEVLNTWCNVAVQVRSINLWWFLILTLHVKGYYPQVLFSKINHHHHISQSYHDGNAMTYAWIFELNNTLYICKPGSLQTLSAPPYVSVRIFARKGCTFSSTFSYFFVWSCVGSMHSKCSTGQDTLSSI